MICAWERISGFNDRTEFNRFLFWIKEQLAKGHAAEVPVQRLYAGSSVLEQKWFCHSVSGKIWRLVWPDPPFSGVFEPVSETEEEQL
jgi:hypothetical protein